MKGTIPFSKMKFLAHSRGMCTPKNFEVFYVNMYPLLWTPPASAVYALAESPPTSTHTGFNSITHYSPPWGGHKKHHPLILKMVQSSVIDCISKNGGISKKEYQK